jgi:heme exporter protein D
MMAEFLHMGGYATYVWTSWGVGFASLGALAFLSWRRMRKLVREADALKAARRAERD